MSVELGSLLAFQYISDEHSGLNLFPTVSFEYSPRRVLGCFGNSNWHQAVKTSTNHVSPNLWRPRDQRHLPVSTKITNKTSNLWNKWQCSFLRVVKQQFNHCFDINFKGSEFICELEGLLQERSRWSVSHIVFSFLDSQFCRILYKGISSYKNIHDGSTGDTCYQGTKSTCRGSHRGLYAWLDSEEAQATFDKRLSKQASE